MKIKDKRSKQAVEIRRQAEEIAREKADLLSENLDALSPEETRQTLHELRVHQIELEIQNEELRIAQAELNAVLARYFDLYNLAPVGYCTVSEVGLILEANLTAAILLGMARDTLAKQPITRFILKEDQDIYYLYRKQLFETGEPQVCELRMVKQDGTSFWTHLKATVVLDADGAPVCRIVLSDITERQRLEAEILNIMEYTDNIVETVREPLLVLNSDLKILTASRSFYDTFKITSEETIGNLIYNLGNRQWDIPKLRVLLETILPQKTTFDDYEVEHDFTTIGRRIMLLNARQIQRELGKERIIILAIEDITERRKIEDGLEKTRKKLKIVKKSAEILEFTESVINTVREPLLVLDSDLKVLSANRSFHDYFKVTPDETTGKLIYDLGNRQWDIPRLRMLLEEILLKDGRFDDYEIEHDFPNIGRRIILLNVRRIHQKEIDSQKILLAIEDITERRKIESGLKKAHEELKELASELKRTTQVKSEFLANMSHELRTPLNAILGFSEVLEDELYGDLNDRQKTYAHHIYNAGKHLLSLINDILDLSKVEAGKMEFEASWFPIRAILASSIVMLREKAMKHGIVLCVEIESDADIHVEADERKIKQILFNLLSNAVKFTPYGGRVTVRAYMAAFENGSEQQRMLEVCVEDTGIGIKEEDLPRLFGEFTQLHQRVLTKEHEGTGLGLALTKRLVEFHHGVMRVESEYGTGSRFYFTLPVLYGKKDKIEE
ncbi:MAG: PAS domain S-box protein [Deltaproteobacteria bacterium]|nr:PAS domain S-box protein [Deltaproteobacteria bacterium]